jgi:beta-galactosidase/beta-glucuronidase
MTRSRWQNLDGRWQFLGGRASAPPPIGRSLQRRITVPFPPESRLSGIGRHYDYMWYRRLFVVPASWRCARRASSCQHILLQFGAVNYDSTVWVNGEELASHVGGYTAFTVDVTAALRASGEQELVVGVNNLVEHDSMAQVAGKQRVGRRQGAIYYKPSSGIWQTVWLEPVAAAHITRLALTPQLSTDSLRVTAFASSGHHELVTAVAYAGSVPVGRATGIPNVPLSVAIPNPTPWSPSKPYLYRLTVTLSRGGHVADRVGSYFGMRSIAIGNYDGQPHILLNGAFVFELGVMDEGMWPDGLYTAPSDTALRNDLIAAKALGFNTVRVHMVVEPDRFYYMADRLGLLIWQDMPSLTRAALTVAEQQEYDAEAQDMLSQLQTHPSIVMWILFNEGWGEFNPALVAAMFARLDPSRLIDVDGGQNCCASIPDGALGDVYDNHSYPEAAQQAPFDNRAVVDGEFGGFGTIVAGHSLSNEGWAWTSESNGAEVTSMYEQAMSEVGQFEVHCGLSGAIYTQLYDVDNELDGLETYDRAMWKVDTAGVLAANQQTLSLAGRLQPGTCDTVQPQGPP